jgi:hypothetical protein
LRATTLIISRRKFIGILVAGTEQDCHHASGLTSFAMIFGDDSYTTGAPSMRSLPKVSLKRLACACSLMAYLTFGMVGCGGNSGPATGTGSELPPEAKQANKNMEEFMKNPPKK